MDDWGDPGAPSVLLAHGMWCDAGMFNDVAQILAKTTRVIVPDFRAHGRSEVPSSKWSAADLADDLAAILDQLAVKKTVLAGFSMGGMASLEFALNYPARLNGLMLIGTSASAEALLRTTEINSLAKIIELTGAPNFMPSEAARHTFSAEFRKKNPREVTRWESVIRAMSRPALIQGLKAVASRRGLLDEIHRIKVPVVVVSGEADQIMKPKLSEAIHRRISGSRLVTYPGVGHAVPLERAGDVADLIAGLIRETGDGRRSS